MVQCISVSSFDEKLLNAFGAPVLFIRLHGKVQWGEAFGVSGVQISAPCNDVVESELGSRESGPVKRGTFAEIKSIDLETFLEEVGKTDGLVTLGRNVEHVDSLAVLGEDIRSVLDQEPNEVHIAVEGSKVEGSEAIVAAAVGIEPRLENLLLLFPISVENNALIASGSTIAVC